MSVSNTHEQDIYSSGNLRLAAQMALPVALYAIAYPILRPFGANLFFLISGFALLSCMFGKRIATKRAYVLFAILTTLVLGASLLEIMPRSWTVYHDNIAALRHWLWIPLLPILITAYSNLLNHYNKFIIRNYLAIMIVVYSISSISNYFKPLASNEIKFFEIYTFTNDNTIVFLSFLAVLFLSNSSKFVKSTTCICILLLSTSGQSLVMSLLVVFVFIFKNSRLINSIYGILLVAFIFTSPFYFAELHSIDANTGIRAMLWRDVLIALADTNSFGVGYGTEYITNNFLALKFQAWTLTPEFGDSRLYVATHSAIYDILLRNGVLIGGVFIWWIMREIHPPVKIDASLKSMYYCVGMLLLTIMLVNVGTSSLNFLMGVSFCLAILNVLRQRSQ